MDPETLRYFTYYLFADKFGFTPDQVDEMDAVLVDAFKEIMKLLKETSKDKSGMEGAIKRGMI